MINIFMLVKDRREFTALTLDHLERFTDFDLVHRLVFVDDSSTDGAAELCREWVARTGHGEVITIEGGSVTNALFHGTQPYLDDPIRWMVKLDNDLILSEDWLDKVLKESMVKGRAADATRRRALVRREKLSQRGNSEGGGGDVCVEESIKARSDEIVISRARGGGGSGKASFGICGEKAGIRCM